MDDATRELTERAQELVRSWKPKLLGLGEGRFASEALALLEAMTADHGCEPLVELLRIPADEKTEEIAAQVVDALSQRLDSVEPLLGVSLAGARTAASPADRAAGDRVPLVFNGMAIDDLVPELLRLASGDAEEAVREEAFNQLVLLGPDVVPALERLEAHPRFGRAASRCLEQIEEHDVLPGSGDPDAACTAEGLLYAFQEAQNDDDAAYALGQLGQLLEDHDWVLGAKALEPVQRYIREWVDAFMQASDDEEEQDALAVLDEFATACGEVGVRLIREDVDTIPVTPGTRRLHDFIAGLATPAPVSREAVSSILEAVGALSAVELRALTRRPSFRRTTGVFNDPRRRPDFLLWKRPAALPPLGDVEAHEGFIYMALSALCNDSDEEFKAIAALALLGDRQALPLLRLVADDPKGGEWADRVVRWDAQLADAEGVDLATWAEEPAPGDEDVSINVMFETAVDTGQAASVPLADAPVGAAEPPAGESSLYEERPESQEPPAELAEPPAGSTEAVPAATGLPETLVSPMEPPGLGRLDDAFDEFVERMERSAGS